MERDRMAQALDISSLSMEDFQRMKVLEAVKKLIALGPLDGITVSDICTAAGISRPTFYHYFENKNAVLQWWWEQLMDHAKQVYPLGNDWEKDLADQICDYLELARENEVFARACAKAKLFKDGYDSVYEYARRARTNWLSDLVRERTGRPPNVEESFAIRFFVLAESSVVADWIGSGAKDDPRAFAARIVRCVPQDLRRALDAGERGALDFL